MYSPKIKPKLVQKLYRLAKDRRIPMTALVNKIIEEYLKRIPLASAEKIKEGLAVSESKVKYE